MLPSNMVISPEVEEWTCQSTYRSRLKRSLSVCATLGLFLTVGLSMSVLVSNNQRTNSPKIINSQTLVPKKPTTAKSDDSSVCVTPGCVLAAAKLLQNMDKKIDPCKDFYSFACGGFEAKTRIPEDIVSVHVFDLISNEVEEQLRSIIEKPIEEKELEPFKLVKKYYQSCLNATRNEEEKLELLKKILQQFGDWPVVVSNKWNDKHFFWDEMIYKFNRAGYPDDYFISLFVYVDNKNSTSNIIFLDEPDPNTPRTNQTKATRDETIDENIENLINVTIQLGANKENARQQLTEAFELESKITALKLTSEERRYEAPLYNPMTIKELQEKVPGIPWLKYIKHFLAPYHVVNENEKVVVKVPDYFRKLSELLAKTPKRILANYLMSKVSKFILDNWEPSSWKECVDNFADSSLENAIGAMYVREFFNKDSRYLVNEMVKDFRSVFAEIIDEKTWMDNKTRAHAQKKIAAMTAHVGYPDELLDDKKLLDYYRNLTLSSDDYHGNYLNLSIFENQQSLKKLRELVNKTEWILFGKTTDVNAYYDAHYNSIQLPAAVLQDFNFDKNQPAYLNYAAIGTTIGHEITHGFDDQGCQFCAKGNLFNWWEQSTKQKYLKLAKCIIDQYDNYTFPEIGMKINGFNTQGENIADNGGIKLAYRAYMKWANRQKTGSQNWDQVEQPLPGLTEYNVRQLFWLGAANTECLKIKPEGLKDLILTDEHSPSRARVHVSFSNMPQFASDFNCPVGSAMNPVQKCELW